MSLNRSSRIRSALDAEIERRMIPGSTDRVTCLLQSPVVCRSGRQRWSSSQAWPRSLATCSASCSRLPAIACPASKLSFISSLEFTTRSALEEGGLPHWNPYLFRRNAPPRHVADSRAVPPCDVAPRPAVRVVSASDVCASPVDRWSGCAVPCARHRPRLASVGGGGDCADVRWQRGPRAVSRAPSVW